MLVLAGPTAHSPFRINNLVNNINTAVNSSAVVAIRSIYVHYVDVESQSDLKTNKDKRAKLDALLDYDSKADASDSLTEVLIKTVAGEADVALLDDAYVIRVIPRPGTISPWSTKATNILQLCGLEQDVTRVERGVALIVQVRKGFPFAEHLKSGVFLDFIYDRMTQVCLSPSRYFGWSLNVQHLTTFFPL